jgi:endonuclease III-like uncharacterized protein
MHLPSLNEGVEAFLPFFNKKEIFTAFILQLNKDLQRAAINLEFSENRLYDLNMLCELIAGALEAAVKRSDFNLQQAFYIIDIDENTAKELLSNDENTYKSLSFLIVKRILQKIILRKVFSDKS